MKFIENLQKRPLWQRKLILWIVVIVIALLLGTVWVLGVSNNFQKLKSTNVQKNLNIPNF